jgi:hypothetical protein
MDLHLLQETPYVSVYCDADNDWLFADWRGELTLPIVQENCLLVAECFLERSYARVLNSNQNVIDFTLNVPIWLHKEYLPLLRYTGVEYMAWVYAPNMMLKPFIDKLVSMIENPVVNLFDDVESAASWLQHTQFHYVCTTPKPRPTAQQQELAAQIEALANRVGYQLHQVQHALVQPRKRTA